MTYFQFQQELSGFDYYDKKTNKQVFRFILFLKRLTPEQVKSKYNKVIRKKDAQ